jgi:hypothetical protein
MPVHPRSRRRPSSGSLLGYPLFFAALAVVLFGAWATMTGRLDLTGLFGGEVRAAERSGARPGMVAMPLTTRELPAFTRITRDHYWDAAKGEFATWWMPEDQVTDDMVTYADMTRLNGRVLAREKGKGYVFRWSEFLPEGSSDGLAGGVPSGKRGLWIDTSKVRGLADLERGNRFDVLATTEIEAARRQSSGLPGVLGAEQELRRAHLGGGLGEEKIARVDVLVQAGVVVRAMRTRAVPVSNTSVFRGQTTGGVPVQEVFVAVDPAELAPLSRAIALGLDLQAAVRSGRPGEDLELPTPDLPIPGRAGDEPSGDDQGLPMAFVETLIDGERRVVPIAPVRGDAGSRGDPR